VDSFSAFDCSLLGLVARQYALAISERLAQGAHIDLFEPKVRRVSSTERTAVRVSCQDIMLNLDVV
jgi:hypothetical protein